MMAITAKIFANNTKKSVIDKLDLKVGVHDVKWIEFEVRSRIIIVQLHFRFFFFGLHIMM